MSPDETKTDFMLFRLNDFMSVGFRMCYKILLSIIGISFGSYGLCASIEVKNPNLYISSENSNEGNCPQITMIRGEWEYVALQVAEPAYQPISFTLNNNGSKSGITAELYTTTNWLQVNRPTLTKRFVSKFKIKEEFVPELLLNSDVLPDHGQWVDGKYLAPNYVPSPETVTLKNRSSFPQADLLLRIKTTGDTEPGNYKLTVSEEEGNASQDICILIKENLIVGDESRSRGIYYRAVSVTSNVEYAAKKRFLSEFLDIREHGFNAVTLYNSGAKNMVEIGLLARSTGLKELILQVPHKQLQEYSGFDKLSRLVKENSVYLMGVDEPNSDTKLQRHLESTRLIRQLGGKVFTAMNLKTVFKIPADAKTEWVNLHIRSFRKKSDFFNLPGGAKYTYYWQVYLERPALNRLRSGLFLYWSKMDGIFPYAYKHFYKNALPYKTDWIDDKGTESKRKQYLSVYPTSTGNISTFQWEGLRQGYDDIRLIDYLDSQLKEAAEKSDFEMALISSIEKEKGERIAKIIDTYGFLYYEDYSKYGEQLDHDLSQFRSWIKAQLDSLL